LNTIEKVFSEQVFSLLDSLVLEPNLQISHGIIVAFSGGCDSLALLALCVKTLGNQSVFPVYVNHNLRSETELEEEIKLNAINCKRLGTSLEVCTLEKGKVLSLAQKRKCGTEEAARLLRYEILERKRLERSCDAIATAHHKQDQIETVAMRLSAGSPVGSLRGIASFDESRHLIRPLLNFDRKELEKYLKSMSFEWSTDSTNEDSSYLRNSFRLEVLPSVRSQWSACDDNILALCHASNTALSNFDAQTVKLERGKGYVRTEIWVFEGMNPACRTQILFLLWDSLMGDADLPMTLASRVLKAIESKTDSRVGANGGVFLVYRGCLWLFVEKNCDIMDFECSFNPCVDQCIVLPNGLVLKSGSYATGLKDGLDNSFFAKSLFMDSALFCGNVRVRFAREGDSIRLKSGRRMVKRLLQDMKIPSNLRSKVPLIEDDEGVCAVFGSVFGGVDRICVKFRTSIAPNSFTLYIVDNEVLKNL